MVHIKKIENLGLLLKFPRDQGDINAGVMYYSSQYSEQSFRPKLTVTYSVPNISIKSQAKAKSPLSLKITGNKISLLVPHSNTYAIKVVNTLGQSLFYRKFNSNYAQIVMDTPLSPGLYYLFLFEGDRIKYRQPFIMKK